MKNPRVYTPGRSREEKEYMAMTKNELLGILTRYEGVPTPATAKLPKSVLVEMILDHEFGTFNPTKRVTKRNPKRSQRSWTPIITIAGFGALIYFLSRRQA